MERISMRTVISVVIIMIAAMIDFFMGAGMNEAKGGAAWLAAIAGFACTIQAIERKKKQSINFSEILRHEKDLFIDCNES